MMQYQSVTGSSRSHNYDTAAGHQLPQSHYTLRGTGGSGGGSGSRPSTPRSSSVTRHQTTTTAGSTGTPGSTARVPQQTDREVEHPPLFGAGVTLGPEGTYSPPSFATVGGLPTEDGVVSQQQPSNAELLWHLQMLQQQMQGLQSQVNQVVLLMQHQQQQQMPVSSGGYPMAMPTPSSSFPARDAFTYSSLRSAASSSARAAPTFRPAETVSATSLSGGGGEPTSVAISYRPLAHQQDEMDRSFEVPLRVPRLPTPPASHLGSVTPPRSHNASSMSVRPSTPPGQGEPSVKPVQEQEVDVEASATEPPRRATSKEKLKHRLESRELPASTTSTIPFRAEPGTEDHIGSQDTRQWKTRVGEPIGDGRGDVPVLQPLQPRRATPTKTQQPSSSSDVAQSPPRSSTTGSADASYEQDASDDVVRHYHRAMTGGEGGKATAPVNLSGSGSAKKSGEQHGPDRSEVSIASSTTDPLMMVGGYRRSASGGGSPGKHLVNLSGVSSTTSGSAGGAGGGLRAYSTGVGAASKRSVGAATGGATRQQPHRRVGAGGAPHDASADSIGGDGYVSYESMQYLQTIGLL